MDQQTAQTCLNFQMNLLKVKIRKEHENILWPIKNFQKYFMAHQYMPKIFHDPWKNPPTPSYIVNVWSLMIYYTLTEKKWLHYQEHQLV